MTDGHEAQPGFRHVHRTRRVDGGAKGTVRDDDDLPACGTLKDVVCETQGSREVGRRIRHLEGIELSLERRGVTRHRAKCHDVGAHPGDEHLVAPAEATHHLASFVFCHREPAWADVGRLHRGAGIDEHYEGPSNT